MYLDVGDVIREGVNFGEDNRLFTDLWGSRSATNVALFSETLAPIRSETLVPILSETLDPTRRRTSWCTTGLEIGTLLIGTDLGNDEVENDFFWMIALSNKGSSGS